MRGASEGRKIWSSARNVRNSPRGRDHGYFFCEQINYMHIETEPTITITKKQYDQLIEDQQFLQALEGAGVDNWEGYEFACQFEKE